MTMLEERSRAAIQAGAFLKELRARADVPEAIRTEAHRLLRHYPSVSDIEQVATLTSPRVFPRNPFGGPAEPAWWAPYRYGPVLDGEH
jgi:hypothetical protein